MPRNTILPRLIRLRDVPHYCGMDRNRFSRELRPFLTEIRIGKQGVAFDRLELDALLDDYVRRNGRPGRNFSGGKTWGENAIRASSSATARGTSTSTSKDGVFAAALEQLTLQRRNDTSQG